MLLGVPLFATVLMLTEERLTRRLRSRGLSSATENYYPADSLIDPAADAESRSDRLVRRLEKSYLRILIKERNHDKLTRRECFSKRIYLTGRKLRLLPELSDSVLVQFSMEEAVREIAEDA